MVKVAICPTVTAFDRHEYRSQIEILEKFAERIHIDLMDGQFAPTKSPDLNQIWLPENIISDIHLMYQRPMDHIELLIKLNPSLVIVHFEAQLDHEEFATSLRRAGIKSGLAILSKTSAEECLELVKNFDHVLVFSGKLGYHGGQADLGLLDKVRKLRSNYPTLEISWDGGINDQNAIQLTEAGVSVLNVGGYIHKDPNPEAAYAKLESLTGTK